MGVATSHLLNRPTRVIRLLPCCCFSIPRKPTNDIGVYLAEGFLRSGANVRFRPIADIAKQRIEPPMSG